MHNTISLKLYSFGIKLLHDPNWTGMELYDYLKQHIRGRKDPNTLLVKTIKNGLLFHIGKWVYDEYLVYQNRFNSFLYVRGEYLLWYLEDFIDFLKELKVKDSKKVIFETNILIESIFNLYEEDEERYWEQINSLDEKFINQAITLSNKYYDEIILAKDKCAEEFAERIFHDRTLCEFISKLIIQIGFDGFNDEDKIPCKWVERVNIPQWAKRAVISRDRGKCALCGKNLIAELEDNYHIDHIIPLHAAGTNDLCNLQLLCQKCNLSKSKNIIAVKTSIPKYLQLKKSNSVI